jgi:hypothetical protein
MLRGCRVLETRDVRSCIARCTNKSCSIALAAHRHEILRNVLDILCGARAVLVVYFSPSAA